MTDPNATPISDSEGQAQNQPAGTPRPEDVEKNENENHHDDHKVAENSPED